MAASSRYIMVNDIQRETSAVSRHERGGRDHAFRSIHPARRDETAHGYVRCRRLARPPPGGAEGSVGERRMTILFALNDT